MTKTKSEPEESAMGFKDKKKALDTLKVLDGRDISYQYNVITGLTRRAKRVLEITKDEEKLSKIRDAVDIFNEWLENYKKEGRSKENFAYLPLETVEAYRGLAKSYGVLEENFLNAYKEEKGDYKKLRDIKTPDGKVTWDIERNRRLKELTAEIKAKYILWFKVDQSNYRGFPTKEHVQCILLGYSPEPAKVKKLIPQVMEKLQETDQPKGGETEGSKSSKKPKKRQHSESSSSSEDSGEEKQKKLKKKSPKKSKNKSE